jgi:hypothetical protein
MRVNLEREREREREKNTSDKSCNMMTIEVIMRKEMNYPQQTSVKGLLFPILPTKVFTFCLSKM